jgi:hypothetical protein
VVADPLIGTAPSYYPDGLDNGTPVFTCVEFDDSAQLRVAKKLGARCK